MKKDFSKNRKLGDNVPPEIPAIDCKRAREIGERIASGKKQLTPQELVLCSEHLRTCPDCREGN